MRHQGANMVMLLNLGDCYTPYTSSKDAFFALLRWVCPCLLGLSLILPILLSPQDTQTDSTSMATESYLEKCKNKTYSMAEQYISLQWGS